MRPAATDELVIKRPLATAPPCACPTSNMPRRAQAVVFRLRDGRDIEALGVVPQRQGPFGAKCHLL